MDAKKNSKNNERDSENSYMQRYKMLGNGWTVAVIQHIFFKFEK